MMLAMEEADKERNRLLLVKHTHMCNTRPFSKTHSLILIGNGRSRQGEKHIILGKHTHTYTIQ